MLEQILDSMRTALNCGEFVFSSGDSLATVIAAAGVPAAPGIYLVWSEPGSELLYVGKSGTVRQDGSFAAQGLRARLRKKQDGVPRQRYFDSLLVKRELRALRIEWFEWNGDSEPPFLSEARVLAAFLRDHGKLPPLNKEA